MSLFADLRAHLECFETHAVEEIHKFIDFVEGRNQEVVTEVEQEIPQPKKKAKSEE